MSPREFSLNPATYGIPSRDQLAELRIWDSHYHGFLTSRDPIQQHHEVMFYVERMGIERAISLEIGGTLRNPLEPAAHDDEQRRILERDKDRVSGIIPIEPGFPDESLAKMERWIRNGPCIGIKYVGSNRRGIPCSHPNNDPIIRFAAELGAVVYIHTWIKVGGEPRSAGGGLSFGESSPMDVAVLAGRFPDVPLICGHSGGDWELGARAIRHRKNVLLEFSGSDPHSGSVEYAVKELGADRIVWGGHGPSRSYSTELSKVLDADLSKANRMKVLGGNYRRIAAGIFRNKGQSLTL